MFTSTAFLRALREPGRAADNSAVRQYTVIFIVPLARRARGPCALQDQVSHRPQSSSASRFTAGAATLTLTALTLEIACRSTPWYFRERYSPRLNRLRPSIE